MARKRIKTLAHEWGIPVEEVLASCERLTLPHAHSESALLSQEEVDRVKAELDDRNHRQALLRRETLVETSAGKALEKRLNATVVRRRHTEPAPAASAAEPFHFEAESSPGPSGPFAAPIFDEPLRAEPEMPALNLPETGFAAAPTPVVATPASTPTPGETPSETPVIATNGAVAKTAEAASVERIAAPPIAREAAAPIA